MKTGSRGKRVFALALSGLMLLLFVAPMVSVLARADEGDSSMEEAQARMDELNEQYKELQAQQNQIDAQINQAAGEKQQVQAQKDQIDAQINNTIEQIDVLDERIALMEERISQKEDEMAEKQEEIDQLNELFKARMNAIYRAGDNMNTLGLLLGADSYSQFLMRAEVVSSVAEHDQALMARLAAERDELEEIQQGIQSDKQDVESDKTTMEEKKDDLGVQMEQANARMQDISAMEREFLANKEAMQAQMKEVQAEIDRIFQEINRQSQSPYVGGEMLWPAPSLGQITCEFGPRFGGSDYHTGMDISGAGAYGATIIAANSGTVKVGNTSFTDGYGYGKYVIIDHGGGMQTLYAHCSSINVSVGQYVSRGEKIAEVGSTGWSTGPHVHFEIRKDGSAVNPISYLQG